VEIGLRSQLLVLLVETETLQGTRVHPMTFPLAVLDLVGRSLQPVPCPCPSPCRGSELVGILRIAEGENMQSAVVDIGCQKVVEEVVPLALHCFACVINSIQFKIRSEIIAIAIAFSIASKK
jgi:hypothetical protein